MIAKSSMWGTQKTLQLENSRRVEGGAKIDVNWTFGDSRRLSIYPFYNISGKAWTIEECWGVAAFMDNRVSGVTCTPSASLLEHASVDGIMWQVAYVIFQGNHR